MARVRYLGTILLKKLRGNFMSPGTNNFVIHLKGLVEKDTLILPL